MKRNLKIYENPILYLTILLIGIGTVMMYSASSTLGVNIHDKYNFYLIRHLIRLFIVIIAFIGKVLDLFYESNKRKLYNRRKLLIEERN